jgi:hypothetical protein
VFATPLTWVGVYYAWKVNGRLSVTYHRVVMLMTSMVVWYTVMVAVGAFGGNLWACMMLSILYAIGLGVWGVGLLARRGSATVQHVTDVPAADVDEYERLRHKRDTLRMQRANGMR